MWFPSNDIVRCVTAGIEWVGLFAPAAEPESLFHKS